MTGEIGVLYEKAKVGHTKGIALLVRIVENLLRRHRGIIFVCRNENSDIILHLSDHRIHLLQVPLDQNDVFGIIGHTIINIIEV
jgi:hypothetical protein